jgi:Flp pilus assembly protein TadG
MRSERRGGERGSASVEFALVLPLLLVLLVAGVQVGVLARDELVLTHSARAGAREAAVEADEDRVRSAAIASAPGLDASALEISIERSGGLGDAVTVSVAYEAPISGLLAGWLFPDVVRLEADATMRQEFG